MKHLSLKKDGKVELVEHGDFPPISFYEEQGYEVELIELEELPTVEYKEEKKVYPKTYVEECKDFTKTYKADFEEILIKLKKDIGSGDPYDNNKWFKKDGIYKVIFFGGYYRVIHGMGIYTEFFEEDFEFVNN